MNIYIWDILTLIWLIVFLVMGANRGFVLTLGRLAVTILSFAAGYGLADAYGLQLAGFLGLILTDTGTAFLLLLSEIILFIIGFLIIRAVGRWLLRLLNRIAHLPVLHTFNRLGGAILGIFEGAILLLIVGQFLALAGLLPSVSQLSSTFLAKYFLSGFL